MDRLFDILTRHEEVFVLIFFVGTWVASTIREARRSRREVEKRRKSMNREAAKRLAGEGRRSGGAAAGEAPPAAPPEPVLFPEPELLEEPWAGESWVEPAAERRPPPPPPPPPRAPLSADGGLDFVSLDEQRFPSSLSEEGAGERFDFLDRMAEEIEARDLGQLEVLARPTGPATRRGWRPQGGWREGVILREILGPPRALAGEDLPGLR